MAWEVLQVSPTPPRVSADRVAVALGVAVMTLVVAIFKLFIIPPTNIFRKIIHKISFLKYFLSINKKKIRYLNILKNNL